MKCFKCGQPAPFGFGLPGQRKDKPKGKRGRIWACAKHRKDARERKKKAEMIK